MSNFEVVRTANMSPGITGSLSAVPHPTNSSPVQGTFHFANKQEWQPTVTGSLSTVPHPSNFTSVQGTVPLQFTAVSPVPSYYSGFSQNMTSATSTDPATSPLLQHCGQQSGASPDTAMGGHQTGYLLPPNNTTTNYRITPNFTYHMGIDRSIQAIYWGCAESTQT